MKYYYLVASLPMINFSQGSPLAISLDELTQLCREQLSEKDFKIFDSVDLVTDNEESLSQVANEFFSWDINLRNAIVNQRVNSHEAAKYKHAEHNFYSEIEGVVQEAISKGNALDREFFIDTLRVNKIDDLSVNAQFDIEFLCAYKLKLIFCMKYNKLDVKVGEDNFNSLVNSIIKNKL